MLGSLSASIRESQQDFVYNSLSFLGAREWYYRNREKLGYSKREPRKEKRKPKKKKSVPKKEKVHWSEERVCDICGEAFLATQLNPRALTCSKECSREHKRRHHREYMREYMRDHYHRKRKTGVSEEAILKAY